MTVKSRIFTNGNISIADEIIEIPTELAGNRNLFKWFGSEDIRLNDYQGIGSFTQFVTNLTFDPAKHVGKIFTISFYAKSPNGNTVLNVYNQNNNSRYFYFHKQLDTALGPDWRYYSYTFINNDRGESYSVSNKVEIYAPTKMGVMVKNIKVEMGTVATNWNRSPEDLGYVLPDWIQNFDNPVQFHQQGVAVKGLEEGVPISLGSHGIRLNELTEGVTF